MSIPLSKKRKIKQEEIVYELNLCKVALCMIYKRRKIDLYDVIDDAEKLLNSNVSINNPTIQRVIALEEYLRSKNDNKRTT